MEVLLETIRSMCTLSRRFFLLPSHFDTNQNQTRKKYLVRYVTLHNGEYPPDTNFLQLPKSYLTFSENSANLDSNLDFETQRNI